jgi:ABC-type dipeptide/oligopeptide/nickel transport system permease subunit
MAAASTAATSAVILGDPTPPTPLRRRIGQVAIVIAVIAVVVLLASPGLIAQVQPTATGDSILQGPSGAHWFGTDQLGRDVFSRTIYGSRPVLIASLLGVVLATVAGVALGVAAGIAPRWLNSVLMRIIDVLLALPVLLIALILIPALPASCWPSESPSRRASHASWKHRCARCGRWSTCRRRGSSDQPERVPRSATSSRT